MPEKKEEASEIIEKNKKAMLDNRAKTLAIIFLLSAFVNAVIFPIHDLENRIYMVDLIDLYRPLTIRILLFIMCYGIGEIGYLIFKKRKGLKIGIFSLASSTIGISLSPIFACKLCALNSIYTYRNIGLHLLIVIVFSISLPLIMRRTRFRDIFWS